MYLYSYEDAKTLYARCIEGITPKSSDKEKYDAGLEFLSLSSEVGIYYR